MAKSALQQAFENFQQSPMYGAISQGAQHIGLNLPQKQFNYVSPLPEMETQAMRDPGYRAWIAQDQAAVASAKKDAGPVMINKTVQYPDWMANAPKKGIPVATPKVPQGVPLGQARVQPTITPTQAPQVLGATAPAGNYPEFKQFTTAPIPANLQALIYDAARKTGIHPAILASVLFSEHGFIADQNKTYNRDEQGNIIPNNYDRGIAQINSIAHPDITDQQAFDPSFAIPWAANRLSAAQQHFNNYNRAIASYNVGMGGANIQGPTPSGMGPRGQLYLNKVAAGLSPELRQQLGIVYAP